MSDISKTRRGKNMRFEEQKRFSVIFLGLSGAGKTTLLRNLSGKALSAVVPTVGLDYTFLEDPCRAVKAKCIEISGSDQFKRIRENFLQAEKVDCIVLVIDSETVNSEEVSALLNEMDQGYREKELPPMGVVINYKKNDVISTEVFCGMLQTRYQDNLGFIQSCSAVDPKCADILFHRMARIAGVPIPAPVVAEGWGDWLYGAAASVASFFVPAARETKIEKNETTALLLQ